MYIWASNISINCTKVKKNINCIIYFDKNNFLSITKNVEVKFLNTCTYEYITISSIPNVLSTQNWIE
jgi:hypothetical protein